MQLPPVRFPGATLASRLKVYDTAAPADGQRGGTPHVHLLCTELYFVLAGRGSVETFDLAHGFRTHPLETHAMLVFSPGTIHRLINPEGSLEILVVMQNSGLPERGDGIAALPEALLSSDEAFREATAVKSLADAFGRRDRAVEGFLELRQGGRPAMESFLQTAAARTAPRRGNWREVVEHGAAAEANETLHRLERIEAGDLSHLAQADQTLLAPGPTQTPGFCGELHRYFDPATLALDGKLRA